MGPAVDERERADREARRGDGGVDQHVGDAAGDDDVVEGVHLAALGADDEVVHADDADALVITSYSIHYTKLYDG